MKASLLVVLLVAGCGNKAKGPPLAPLPPDKVEDEPKAKVEPPKQGHRLGRSPSVLWKSSSREGVHNKAPPPGAGKRVAARIAPKTGTRPSSSSPRLGVTQSVGTESQSDIVPTVVLSGVAEITAADKNTADYALKIEKTDARGPRQPRSDGQVQEVLASTIGFEDQRQVGATGATAT
jgi:hypothetical protein